MDENKSLSAKDKRILYTSLSVLFAIILVGTGLIFAYAFSMQKKAGNYTIQLEQYCVEYSEEYDYSDLYTVEYPRIETLDEDIDESLNALMYDTAMDRINYWHLKPDDSIRAFQEEYFSLFCSDVRCDVCYHSPYLMSIVFREIYTTDNPVSGAKYTERALNMDLVEGEVYGLSDILYIDEDFVRLWITSYNEAHSDPFALDDETVATFLAWFQGEDDELNSFYEFRPYFYITEDKDFVIGISIDPNTAAANYDTYRLHNSAWNAKLTAQQLKPYQNMTTRFWGGYSLTEEAGEIIPCNNWKKNLWFGEGSSAWEYWEAHDYLQGDAFWDAFLHAASHS